MEKPFCPICEKEYEPGDKFCRQDGAELIFLSGDSMAGMVFDDRYRLLHKIGEGGMGAVYKADQISTGKHVAIKMLASHLTESQATVKRFLREVRLQSRLSHPNIVTVIDFSLTPDKQHYFVMEFVDGTSLRNMILNNGGFSLPVFHKIASQILFALDYAHNQGVIHRDLKGENIMVASIGHEYVVKILDFGLAKAIYESDQQSSVELTRMGKAFGTPAYMSPEQAMGEVDKISSRSDLYSIGVIFYQMLTGRLPFESNTPWGYLHKHLNEPPPPITSVKPDLPKELERVIMRCLEKDPENRYQRALNIKEDLEKVASSTGDDPTRKEDSSWIGAAMMEDISLKQKARILAPLIILLLLLAGWMAYQVLTFESEKPELAQLVLTEKEKTSEKEPEEAAPPKTVVPEQVEQKPALVEKIVAPGQVEQKPIEAPKNEPVPQKQVLKLDKPVVKKVIPPKQTREERIHDMLAGAYSNLLANRLTSPAGDNAYERYQAVLRLDPENSPAKEGIKRIAIRYAELAQGAIARKDFAKSEKYLHQAKSINPGLTIIAETVMMLKSAKRKANKSEAQIAREEWERKRDEALRARQTERQRKIAERDKIRHERLIIKVDKYLKKAERYALSNRFAKAEKVIAKARRILPGYKGIDKMADKIARMKKNAPPKKSWFDSF